MTTQDQSNPSDGSAKRSQENQPDLPRKKSAAPKRSNLHLRDLEAKAKRSSFGRGQELSSPSLTAATTISYAVSELYWRSSSAREIDLSKQWERGLATSSSSGQKMYVLGAEFAITAIVAAVAIARRRADLSSAALPSVSETDSTRERHFSSVKIILSDEEHAGATASSASADRPAEKSQTPSIKDSQLPVAATNAYLYGSTSARPKVVINLSDTLVSIAEKHFHDGNVGWLIADLNREKISESFDNQKRIVEVQNAETLELPIWKEIVAFYQRKPTGASAENLITIVTGRTIEKDIVDSVLSPVVNPPES